MRRAVGWLLSKPKQLLSQSERFSRLPPRVQRVVELGARVEI